MTYRHRLLACAAIMLMGASCDLLHHNDAGADDPLAGKECLTHQDCADQQDSKFCTVKHACRELRSEDCWLAAGNELAPNSVLIGSLFATKGSTGLDNLARQHAAQLAVEEIDQGGGIPAPGLSSPRNMLLVACDASVNPARAARHLVTLGAVAIIGPAENAALSDVAEHVTSGADTLLINPVAMTTAADNAWDGDRGWSMTPTVEQRTPMVQTALTGLENELRVQRARELKLGVLYRDDANGRASVAALRSLSFAGDTLALPGKHIRIDRYGDDVSKRMALASAYRVFAPDVIMLIDGPEVISDLLEPIEKGFVGAEAQTLPHYLLREGGKVSLLLGAVQRYPGLRERIRGVGVTPTVQAKPIFERFQQHYDARWRDHGTGVPGTGSSYDAAFAIANAVAGLEQGQESSSRVALALHAMSEAEQVVPVGALETSNALDLLALGEHVAALGSMTTLRWDENGSTRTGALEVWCLGSQNQAPFYATGGLTLDIETQTYAGVYAPCPVITDANAAPPLQVETAPPVAGAESTPPPMAAGSSAPPPPPTAAGSPAPPPNQGGMAGSSGSEMPVDPVDMPAVISCGNSACSPELGEFCCVTQKQSWLGSSTELSCAQSANGASPGSCTQSLFCASDKECPTGQVCCADDSAAQCEDALTCTLKQGSRRACASQRDCATGSRCCLTDNSTSTQCAPICSSYLGSHVVCDAVSDCPTTFLASCKRSDALPNVKQCEGPGL